MQSTVLIITELGRIAYQPTLAFLVNLESRWVAGGRWGLVEGGGYLQQPRRPKFTELLLSTTSVKIGSLPSQGPTTVLAGAIALLLLQSTELGPEESVN